MDVSQSRQGMREWLDPAGVDSLLLLDEPKNLVEIALRLKALPRRQGESCQSRDLGDFLFGNCHQSLLFEK